LFNILSRTKWQRTLASVAATVAATAVAIAATAVPARADFSIQGAIAGSGTGAISLTLMDSFFENPGGQMPTMWLYSRVMVGTTVQTSATACKVTLYAELDKPGSNVWKSPKVTRGCDTALDVRGQWFSNSHGIGPTSGTDLNVHGCVDLYYNSSSSGWQRCMETGWHAWNSNG
jgi:hypothetical protein